MGQTLLKAAAVLINSFEKLDPEINKDLNSKFRKVLNLEPFNLSSPSSSSNVDDYHCIPWLDERNSATVAYIGFGTVVKPTPIEHSLIVLILLVVAELAEALEARLPQIKTRDLGKIVPWAYHPRDKFWCIVQPEFHNSLWVQLSLREHCNRCANDQLAILWGPPYQHIDGGKYVENWCESGTMRALELVLSCEKGKKLKEQIGHFTELALKGVGPKGSSSQNFNTLLDVVTGHNL
ncbi:hypothetical protein Acr_00g0044920 [Actinidia rufa]|uniref:Uncharacterized protein n=1 Tax=Actinidia rufa TaxID=165716 RepID=A0A7J0DKH4_9ERIC|nr:hypothetical protein Acr_00g0044920 [Actinidia rufa]